MPLIDKPIQELERYTGTNPKPADFDAYWDEALAEMYAVDPQVEFVPHPLRCPTVECYDMYFTGVGGARLYAKHIRPKNIAGKIPAVLLFHGYSGSSANWFERIAYAASGVAVFFLDVRGQGGKSEDVGGVKGNTYHGHIIRGLIEEDPHKLLFRNIFLDTAQLARIAMSLDFVDETRVCATGGSQGGGLSVACAALEPRVARLATVYPFLSDYKRVWDMDLDIAAYEELRTYFRNFDPRHERENEIFTRLGYIDIHNLAPRIRADTIMFTGLIDSICPPSTQYAVYNNMTCPKRHVIYPDFGHEWLRDADDMIYDFVVNWD